MKKDILQRYRSFEYRTCNDISKEEIVLERRSLNFIEKLMKLPLKERYVLIGRVWCCKKSYEPVNAKKAEQINKALKRLQRDPNGLANANTYKAILGAKKLRKSN